MALGGLSAWSGGAGPKKYCILKIATLSERPKSWVGREQFYQNLEKNRKKEKRKKKKEKKKGKKRRKRGKGGRRLF